MSSRRDWTPDQAAAERERLRKEFGLPETATAREIADAYYARQHAAFLDALAQAAALSEEEDKP